MWAMLIVRVHCRIDCSTTLSQSRSSRYPTSPILRALDLWYLPSLIVLMSFFYPISIRRDFFHSRKSCNMPGSWFLDTSASRCSPVSLFQPIDRVVLWIYTRHYLVIVVMVSIATQAQQYLPIIWDPAHGYFVSRTWSKPVFLTLFGLLELLQIMWLK